MGFAVVSGVGNDYGEGTIRFPVFCLGVGWVVNEIYIVFGVGWGVVCEEMGDCVCDMSDASGNVAWVSDERKC